MTVPEALAEADLHAALSIVETQLDDAPSDAALLLVHVELLAIDGRYPDAWRELQKVESPDAEWPLARRRFRQILRAANDRARGKRPGFLFDAPHHARRRWQAVCCLRNGEREAAADKTDRADDSSPHLIGHIDGREFDGLRDIDDRFASVLEAFIGKRYVWIPFEHLRKLTIRPAINVLDCVFRPARIRLSDATEWDAILPMCYPHFANQSDAFSLGIETDHVPEDGPAHCFGGKQFLLGDEEVDLAETKQIDFRAWA